MRSALLLPLLLASHVVAEDPVQIEGVDFMLQDDIQVPIHRVVHGLGAVKANVDQLWPGGVVPWYIDTTVNGTDFDALEEDDFRILWAVKHMEENTCIRMPRCTPPCQKPYVRFVAVGGTTCSSRVGLDPVRQVNQINLAKRCTAGAAVHEIGHALGLKHEQARNDRDDHVKVMWEYINKDKVNNFIKTGETGRDIYPYDYSSIMHYTPFGFTTNGERTLITPYPTGNRVGFSPQDIAVINFMYNDCKPLSAPSCAASKEKSMLIPSGVEYSVEFNAVGRGNLTVSYPTLTAPGANASTPEGGKGLEQVNTVITFLPTEEDKGKTYTLAATFTGPDGTATCSVEVVVARTRAVCMGKEADHPMVCSGHGVCRGGFPYPCVCDQGWGGWDCEGPPHCPHDELFSFDIEGSADHAVVGKSFPGSEGRYLRVNLAPVAMKAKWITAWVSKGVKSDPTNEKTDGYLELRRIMEPCLNTRFTKFLPKTDHFYHFALGLDWEEGEADLLIDGEHKETLTLAGCPDGIERLMLYHKVVWDELHLRCNDFVEVEGMGITPAKVWEGGALLRLKLRGDVWVDSREVREAIAKAFTSTGNERFGWNAQRSLIVDSSLVVIDPVDTSILTIGPFRPAPQYTPDGAVTLVIPPNATKSGKTPLMRVRDRTFVPIPSPTVTLAGPTPDSHTPSPTSPPASPSPSMGAGDDDDGASLGLVLGLFIPLAVVTLGLLAAVVYLVLRKPAPSNNPTAPNV